MPLADLEDRAAHGARKGHAGQAAVLTAVQQLFLAGLQVDQEEFTPVSVKHDMIARRRDQHVDRAAIHAFIDTLEIPETAKEQLKSLTPATYIGNAGKQAEDI